MKKILALILAGMMIFALASCGNTENNETTKAPEKTENTTGTTATTGGTEEPEDTTAPENTTTGTPEEPEDPEGLADTLTGIIDQIYEKHPVTGMMSSEVDLSDAEMLKHQTGIESGSLVEEAYVSGPMMTSVAYEMVIVRVKDAADAETIANEMQKNADPGKWICVRAEAVQIGVSGDIIVMVMTSEEEATALITAFTELCGGELDLFLEQ